MHLGLGIRSTRFLKYLICFFILGRWQYIAIIYKANKSFMCRNTSVCGQSGSQQVLPLIYTGTLGTWLKVSALSRTLLRLWIRMTKLWDHTSRSDTHKFVPVVYAFLFWKILIHLKYQGFFLTFGNSTKGIHSCTFRKDQ